MGFRTATSKNSSRNVGSRSTTSRSTAGSSASRRVYVSPRRDTTAARRFFETALGAHGAPAEVVTDRAPALRAVIEELIPAAFHNTGQYANNRIEADHGRLKARLRPMRGLKRAHTARVVIRGHALMQNVRRGHYQLGVEARPHRRVAAAFTELARTI
jgi:IS6 family transposase